MQISNIKITADIKKFNPEKQMIFGWASIIEWPNGSAVVDSQQDIIEICELENAAYDFVLHVREASDMHDKSTIGIGRLVESVVFSREKQQSMGIPEGILPIGWWIGFKIYDDAVWEGIKSGKYRAFSIGGMGTRTEI